MGTGAVGQAAEAAAVSAYEQTQSTAKAEKTTGKSKVSGKTIGEPQLSEKAQKYYEQLKKKYGNMDFILVSKDMKAVAQSQAGSYANANKMVVLIDEDKIERMAEDENYRKKYEGIISGATSQMQQLKSSLTASGAKVKGYGMQVNDGGNTSFFAVIDKSLQAQKKRIEKKAQQRAEDKKKAQKEEKEKRAEKAKAEKEGKADGPGKPKEDLVTVTASSIDELLNKINDTMFAAMSDNMETEAEKRVGHNFDYSA